MLSEADQAKAAKEAELLNQALGNFNRQDPNAPGGLLSLDQEKWLLGPGNDPTNRYDPSSGAGKGLGGGFYVVGGSDAMKIIQAGVNALNLTDQRSNSFAPALTAGR